MHIKGVKDRKGKKAPDFYTLYKYNNKRENEKGNTKEERGEREKERETCVVVVNVPKMTLLFMFLKVSLKVRINVIIYIDYLPTHSCRGQTKSIFFFRMYFSFLKCNERQQKNKGKLMLRNKAITKAK